MEAGIRWQPAINQGQSINFTCLLTFDATGEYTLRVYEEQRRHGRCRYDDSVYYVTVNVTDQGNDGQMDAVVTNLSPRAQRTRPAALPKEIAFVNDYQPAAVTVTLNVTKVLEGQGFDGGASSLSMSAMPKAKRGAPAARMTPMGPSVSRI